MILKCRCCICRLRKLYCSDRQFKEMVFGVDDDDDDDDHSHYDPDSL